VGALLGTLPGTWPAHAAAITNLHDSRRKDGVVEVHRLRCGGRRRTRSSTALDATWPPGPARITRGPGVPLGVTEATGLLGSRAFTYAPVARHELPSVRLGGRLVLPKVAMHKMHGSVTESRGRSKATRHAWSLTRRTPPLPACDVALLSSLWKVPNLSKPPDTGRCQGPK